MRRKERFSVSLYTNPSGVRVYRVQGRMPDGRQMRRNFRTYQEAVGYKGELEVEALNEPAAIKTKRTRLTDEQLADAEAALQRLKGTGHTLAFATEFFLRKWRPAVVDKTVADAYQEFLLAKTAKMVRPRTMTDYRSRVGRLAKKHPTRLVSELTADDLAVLITAPSGSSRTFNGNRRVLHGFFEWCVKRKFCPENPVVDIEVAEVDAAEPSILSLAEVKDLLRTALTFKDGVLVPYVALALFSGLRPAELARISWNAIDLTERLLTVDGPAAKLRQRRVVELSENVVAWLLPYRDKPIVGHNWRRDFDALRRLCGFKARLKPSERKGCALKDWPDDVLRHTAISHHLALHQHEGKTATWAGNSPDVLQKHYRALVKPAEAAAYWSLLPSNVTGQVVALPTAA